MQTTSKDFQAKSFSSVAVVGWLSMKENSGIRIVNIQMFLRETLVVDFSYRALYMTYIYLYDLYNSKFT